MRDRAPLAFIAVTLAAAAAEAQLVVGNGAAPIPIAEDFDAYANGEVAGIFTVTGARIAEDCFGQTTTEQPSGFELTVGNPLGPPTLAPPPAQDGVFLTKISGHGRVAGMAQGAAQADVGEGAITIVYDQPQAQVGLFLYGTLNSTGGNAVFRCFDAAGALIGAASVPSIPDRDLTITSLGAPIVALTFTNTDTDGLALDDLRHSVPPPAPAPFCFGTGAGTPCPCGNSGAAGHGCRNGTFASGARLDAFGASGLQIVSGTPNQFVLFFRGDAQLGGGAGIPFGDGLLCVGSNIVRLSAQVMDGAGAAQLASVPPPPGPAPAHYQGWYRDPALSPCGALFNLTNGLTLP